MKKLKFLAPAVLALTLALSGCGNNNAPDTVAEPDNATQDEVTEPAVDASDLGLDTPADATETAEEPEVAPEGKVRSQLTNEWVDESLGDIRPIAIMIPNDTGALPQYSNSKAGVYYECLVEGGITRTMAIIEDWENLTRLGNIRSCRDYYVYWAYEWDSIYMHYGNPFYADYVLGLDQTERVNGGSAPSGVIFKVENEGRKSWQTSYTSGEGIQKAIDYYKFSKTHTSNYKKHFQFTSETKPNTLADAKGSLSAKKVDLAPCYTVNKPYFTYNEEDGLYYRFQYGSEHIDAAFDTQLSFTNIILQNTYYEVRDAKGYLAFRCHDKGKTGWYITQGRAIPITWEKTADFEPTHYYDSEGNEIVLNTGKTMICILEDGEGVPTFE